MYINTVGGPRVAVLLGEPATVISIAAGFLARSVQRNAVFEYPERSKKKCPPGGVMYRQIDIGWQMSIGSEVTPVKAECRIQPPSAYMFIKLGINQKLLPKPDRVT